MRLWICLLLVSIAFEGQESNPPGSRCTVQGRVIDAATGEAVRKARVTLESSSEGHEFELVATTGDGGRFRFIDVKSGSYMLTAQKSGFLPGGYGVKEYHDELRLLTLVGGDEPQDIVLSLFPAGSISGRVFDSDGDPAVDYQVVLWARRGHGQNAPYRSADYASTNSGGEYRFEGLMPDKYYVSAGEEKLGLGVREIPVDGDGRRTKVREIETYYPATLSRSDAELLKIAIGEEKSGIDIRMQRAPLLTVKGRIAGALDSTENYHVSADLEQLGAHTSEQARILPDGEFTVQLPPGGHSLALTTVGVNGLVQLGSAEVNLTDQDVSGVVITRYKPAQVTVRVVIEGEEDRPVTNGSVSLNPNAGADGRGGYTAYPPRNGTYLIDDVPPGKYSVWFNNATDYYLKSVQSGRQTLDPESIEITEGANLNLLLIYSKNVAFVSGDVREAQDGPASSVHVVFISEAETSPWRKVEYPQMDQSLRFTVGRLAPGKYLAFAAEEGDPDAWDNPDFVRLLQSNGVELDLHENERANVHLKSIPKDTTDRLKRELGL